MQADTKKESGFTLVELLIAVFILSIGALAWGRTLGGSTKNRAISSDITVASEIANAKMELLALELQGASPSPPWVENSTIQGVNYNLSWTILEDANISAIWIIDMNVTWQRYGQRSIQYQRIVTGG